MTVTVLGGYCDSQNSLDRRRTDELTKWESHLKLSSIALSVIVVSRSLFSGKGLDYARHIVIGEFERLLVMSRPHIHHASDNIRISWCSEAPRRMVRCRMRDEKKICAILLAPAARVAVRMPDKVNRPVPQGRPGKRLDSLLMGVNTHQRPRRNQLHQAVIVSSDARIVKAMRVLWVGVSQVDSENLCAGWRGFVRPGKWESVFVLSRGKRRRRGALSCGPLLQDGPVRDQINAKPLEHLFISELKAISEAQHLVDAGQSSGLDSRQCGMRDDTPWIVKAHRERLAHAFDLRRPQSKLNAPLSDSLPGIQRAPQQQMIRQIFLANLCEAPQAGRSPRRETVIVPPAEAKVQIDNTIIFSIPKRICHNGNQIKTPIDRQNPAARTQKRVCLSRPGSSQNSRG